ncbi:hypothetical protein Ancab_011326 [Ancistrocladus abbreviatus]
MEMGSANQERGYHFCSWLKAECEKLRCTLMEFRRTTKNLAKDDPRRMVHSMKVGRSITLVSLFYYFEPLHEGFGVFAIWAVLTVIVIFEYSVYLHDLTAINLEKLGNFLEGDGMTDEKKAFVEEFKTIINSKNNEDSLVNFANWEPHHGHFRYRHPWSQYQRIGNLARHCASIIEALNGYLYAEIQATEEMRSRFEGICMKMSTESGKALKELSSAINRMTQPPSSTKSHLEALKSAARDLNSTPGTSLYDDNEFSEGIPVATVALLLTDVVHYAEKFAESVQGLASLARFKATGDDKMAPNRKPNLARQGALILRCLSKGVEHVVMI